MGLNVEKLMNDLKKQPEMDPDKHDGCYELMREIVKCYANLDSLSACTNRDLNAVYSVPLGTWKLNVEKKKEYINHTCLSPNDKTKMNQLIDRVWDDACYSKYENREKGKPSIGLFGTGFYFFSEVEGEKAGQFIQMLIDIDAQTDDEKMFEIASKMFESGFKGMGAASASIMLHCLKPYSFPILNGNFGHGNIYEKIGVNLEYPGKITTYIDNCRKIKAFRDHKFPFKNYRILDKWAWKLDEYEDGKKGVELKKDKKIIEYPHNQILYGPPGTGKTYNSTIYSVAIVENKSYEEVKVEAREDYPAVKARYEGYKKQGRIAFTTFHQSYGYEEFIEGIRPVMANDEPNLKSDVKYSIESGVFKAFCEKATMTKNDREEYGLNDNPNVWKVSLAKAKDNPVRDECLKNNHIRIGWDEYGEEISEDNIDDYGGKNPLNAFINKMRVGDIVLSCYTSSVIDAVGVVTGDYRWDESYSYYKRVRDVKWIVKGIRENIIDINNGSVMTLSTVYKMKVSVGDVMRIIEKYESGKNRAKQEKENYVFIIDEINRGNISKIFGELITLIEDTKRAGAAEAMEVTLPYSGSSFSVPDNVYILGTMNTADRSIALMDTALRRRFSFVEMMPDTDVIKKLGITNVEGLDVVQMLNTINARIEFLYDREHTIGHAFFTRLKEKPTVDKLADIFEKSIIPLLQEYFYEDYRKIQLVLGDNKKSDDKYRFIKRIPVPDKLFKESIGELDDIPEYTYEINKSALLDIQSYIEIM